MPLVGFRGGLVPLAVMVAAASCGVSSPMNRAETVCNAYCECVYTSPTDVEMCVTDQCLPVLPPVTDECLDCVVGNANSCTALDAQCTDLCVDNSQP